MKLRHLKIVERRMVSQLPLSTAPPPPLIKGWGVVVATSN